MFGLFKSKKKFEHERRVQIFYKDCVLEIEEYIRDHSEPTREDILKIAINAKITRDLFDNVKEIQPEAREFLYPLVTNGLAVLITIDNMEEYAALTKMQSLIENTYDELAEKHEAEMTLPAINRAFIMSTVISFDRVF